jgi:hypothetical protein
MSDITLSNSKDLVKKHEYVTAALEGVINKAVLSFQVNIALPNKLDAQTPSELFSRAAEFRGHLDTITTVLSAIMVLNIQLKRAATLAARAYKDALTAVFRQNYADVNTARGFEEREMLAQAYMPDDVIKDHIFWKDTLTTVEDTIEVMKLKMRMFKGGLDTILTQTSLAKTNGQISGFTLGADQKAALDASRAPVQAEEGEVSF